jgi:hypothetical protein
MCRGKILTILTIDKFNGQPYLQGRQRLKPLADRNQKLYELKRDAFDSSEGAWAILSRRLQVVADSVPLSNYCFKHQNLVPATSGRWRVWRIVPLLCLLVIVAACDALPAPTQPTAAPLTAASASQPKQLATVYISPTPNVAEQQATRLASTPTPNPQATPTPAPTATVYIGVFLGEEGAGAVGISRGDEAQPTAVQVRCSINPAVDVLGVNWQADEALTRSLGCPIEGVVPFEGVAQTFERGVMYLQPGAQTWAIAVGSPGQYWAISELPDFDTGDINVPPGLLPPSSTFAAMWEGVDGVREALGFAQFPESDADLAYQRFEGGTLFHDGETGQVYALLLDGRVQGPY